MEVPDAVAQIRDVMAVSVRLVRIHQLVISIAMAALIALAKVVTHVG